MGDVLSFIHRVSRSCLLTQRHIGVAAVLIVTRVGIAIRADSFPPATLPYKRGVAKRCSIPTGSTGVAVNNATFP